MARKTDEVQVTRVFEAVRSLARPVAIEEIVQALGPTFTVPRRTLQRWLANMVADGRLHREGTNKGARYQVPAVPPPVAAGAASPLDGRLSPEALVTKTLVSQPLGRRHPIGYNAAFLDNYRPNESAYLSEALRRKLLELGRTTGGDQPAGTYVRKVMDRLLIDLSWNSSRLEGNTYSLLETQRLLELGERAEGKLAREAQMIINHRAAIELLADQASEIGFNRYTLCNLHALLSENLLPNPAAGGRLRAHPVAITGSVFHPLEVPSAIEERFDQILATTSAITDAFEQAFFAMVHLPYLQPFEDVNKRVSRLAANIPLVRHNLGPLSFIDVPVSDYTAAVLGVYELNRVDYLRDVFEWAYERSCARYAAVRQSLGEPDLFRLRLREPLSRLIHAVVSGRLDKKAAAALIRDEAAHLPNSADVQPFAELAEAELAGLHAGNFSRHRLRPSEFAAWQQVWH